MILLTGATGCTGSYLLEALLNDKESAYAGQPIIAWVRNPARLRQQNHPRLRIWEGGLEALERYRPQLAQVTALIHPATVWGGPQTFEINLRQSWRLLQALNPAHCRHVHLFSTASLLDSRQHNWPQALSLGTDYIRSKAALHQRLANPPLPVSIYYPTVVLGGDARHPYSAVGAALPDLPRWLPLARWLRPDGRLHLIHARDIARIVVHRISHEAPPARLVLGNPAIGTDDLLATLLHIYAQKPARLRLPLAPALPYLLPLLRPWMSPWDRFSLYQRDLAHQAVNASDYGLPEDLIQAEAMLRAVGRELRATGQ